MGIVTVKTKIYTQTYLFIAPKIAKVLKCYVLPFCGFHHILGRKKVRLANVALCVASKTKNR